MPASEFVIIQGKASRRKQASMNAQRRRENAESRKTHAKRRLCLFLRGIFYCVHALNSDGSVNLDLRVPNPHREIYNSVGNAYVGFVPIGVAVGIDAWE